MFKTSTDKLIKCTETVGSQKKLIDELMQNYLRILPESHFKCVLPGLPSSRALKENAVNGDDGVRSQGRAAVHSVVAVHNEFSQRGQNERDKMKGCHPSLKGYCWLKQCLKKATLKRSGEEEAQN